MMKRSDFEIVRIGLNEFSCAFEFSAYMEICSLDKRGLINKEQFFDELNDELHKFYLQTITPILTAQIEQTVIEVLLKYRLLNG